MQRQTPLIPWANERLWYQDHRYQNYKLSHIQRMIVLRINVSDLIVISPIALTTQLQISLSKIGTIKAIIAPSPTFHDSLSDWWLAYPNALFYATPSLIKKRTDLNFDGALSRHTHNIWQGELLQTALGNLSRPTKMFFCDLKTRTLIMPDQLLGIQSSLPFGQNVSTFCHGVYQPLGLPFLERRQFKNKAALRSSVQEIMTWPFEQIISTHGLCIKNDAKELFFQAFKWAF